MTLNTFKDYLNKLGVINYKTIKLRFNPCLFVYITDNLNYGKIEEYDHTLLFLFYNAYKQSNLIDLEKKLSNLKETLGEEIPLLERIILYNGKHKKEFDEFVKTVVFHIVSIRLIKEIKKERYNNEQSNKQNKNK